jgi:hypothetical protein
LASEQGIGFWVGGYQDECYLRPTPGTPADDIMLVNMGITILPDAEAAAFQTGVVRGVNSTTNGFSPTTVHKTFNHRNARSLQHLTDCTADAPEAWRKFDSGPCDDCQRANCDKVHSKRQAAKRGDADGTFSMDIWSVNVPHVHGGQPNVLGFHHNGSRLNKFYLLKSGHESETTKATRLASGSTGRAAMAGRSRTRTLTTRPTCAWAPRRSTSRKRRSACSPPALRARRAGTRRSSARGAALRATLGRRWSGLT